MKKTNRTTEKASDSFIKNEVIRKDQGNSTDRTRVQNLAESDSAENRTEELSSTTKTSSMATIVSQTSIESQVDGGNLTLEYYANNGITQNQQVTEKLKLSPEPTSLPIATTPTASKPSTRDSRIDYGSNLTLTERNDRAYLCLHDKWAGNSNCILEVTRAKHLATQENLNLALTLNTGEKLESSFLRWYSSLFDPVPEIYVAEPGESLNCQKNISGKEAFYTNFENLQWNLFMPEIGKYLWPRKDIREKAERAISGKYDNTSFLSVHRRAMRGCHKRANKYHNRNCTKEIEHTMCDLDYATVQERFNPSNLKVVLFTDSLNPELDATFPIKDEEDFFVQLWMMVLAKEHVGNPMSTVDKIVKHYRYSLGNSVMYPEECYYGFKEEYVVAERAEAYKRLHQVYYYTNNTNA